MKRKDYTYPLAIIAASASSIFLLQILQFLLNYADMSDSLRLFISSYGVFIALVTYIFGVICVFVDSYYNNKK